MTAAGTPLEIRQVELDPPKQGEVLVRLLASGVCHSYLHLLNGDWEGRLPAIIGHEGAGLVVEVGDGVTERGEGDLVALSWTPSCRKCRYCVMGRPQLCVQAAVLAYDNLLPDGTTRTHDQSADIYPF